MERVERVRSCQADSSATLWLYESRQECPAFRRRAESSCRFRAGNRHFCLAGLQIRGFETGAALPKERSFTRIVTWSEGLLIFPDAGCHHVILEVLTHARKMLNNG